MPQIQFSVNDAHGVAIDVANEQFWFYGWSPNRYIEKRSLLHAAI